MLQLPSVQNRRLVREFHPSGTLTAWSKKKRKKKEVLAINSCLPFYSQALSDSRHVLLRELLEAEHNDLHRGMS